VIGSVGLGDASLFVNEKGFFPIWMEQRFSLVVRIDLLAGSCDAHLFFCSFVLVIAGFQGPAVHVIRSGAAEQVPG